MKQSNSRPQACTYSSTASEIMPESGCAKSAGVTGKLDTVGAQNKPAGEATVYAEVLLRICIWEFISSLHV